MSQGDSASSTCVIPNVQNVSAFIKMPMPRDLKLICALMGGVGYYRKLLCELSERLGPITSLFKKGVRFEFTPS